MTVNRNGPTTPDGMWECDDCCSNGFDEEDEWHQDWCPQPSDGTSDEG